MTGAELIRRMAEGDRDAFRQIYDRHAREIYPLILKVVRDPADAADVLQEVFWEAWQTAASYDPVRGTAEAWLFMRARTLAIDRLRSVRRRNGTFGAPLDEGLATAPEPGAPERAEQPEIVGPLERLPDAQREVLALAYYAGLTQTEIAQRLEQPLGTVKTRIRQAVERLREVLGTS